MKRINFIIVFFVFYSFYFISCDQNVISSNSTTTIGLAKQSDDDKKITKKSESFQRTDTSSYSYTFPTREDLSMKDGYVYAHVSSGTGDNKLPNWVLSQEYKRLDADGGFEVDIYCGQNMNRAGMHWFDKKSYSMYFFEIFSDGRFYIQLDLVSGNDSNWSDVLKLDVTKSHVEVDKFNRLKVKKYDNGEIDVFVNGYLVYTFPAGSLKFDAGSPICVAYQLKKDVTYSKDLQAEALFKVLNIWTLKK